jgi:exosortase
MTSLEQPSQSPVTTASNIGVLEDFRLEFLKCWHRVPYKAFFFALLVIWLCLFHFLGNSTLGYVRTPSLIYWMYNAYKPGSHDQPDDSHLLAVPFVVLGLFWWKRNELIQQTFRNWWPGLVIIAGALFLHLLGYVIQQPRISIVAFFTGIYGLMGLAWGRAWLQKSFFPFCLFAFCVPLGSQVQPITFPLRILVTQIVAVIAKLLSIEVVRQGTILSNANGQYNYDVAAACSGIRSLFATVGIAVVYAAVSFKSPWKRVLLVIASFPLAVIGNVLRLLSIVLAAEIAGVKAGNSVHEGGPWGIWSLLPYISAFVGLFYLGGLLHKRKEPEVQPLPTLPV